jgi:hypothetical protein
MKKMFTKMLLPVAMFALLTGCKKDEDNTPTQPTPISPTETFNYSDAWGLLAAVKTVTTQSTPIGPIEIELGTAVAAFNTAEGSTTYQDAGNISCKSKALTKQSNNSYVFQPSQTDATGIDFSNGISNWTGSGSTGVPAFSAALTVFPGTPTINEINSLDLANGQSIQWSYVNNADSILVILASGSNYVKKTVGGSSTSAYFSAAELSSLEASQYGMIQVTPYYWEPRTDIVLGKKVYMVNQVTVTDFIEFK